MNWNRLLWGVVRKGNHLTPDYLIGNLWCGRYHMRESLPGEPTRALLFCTRAQAREWCMEHGPQFRPVRVRESVKLA